MQCPVYLADMNICFRSNPKRRKGPADIWAVLIGYNEHGKLPLTPDLVKLWSWEDLGNSHSSCYVFESLFCLLSFTEVRFSRMWHAWFAWMLLVRLTFLPTIIFFQINIFNLSNWIKKISSKYIKAVKITKRYVLVVEEETEIRLSLK